MVIGRGNEEANTKAKILLFTALWRWQFYRWATQ